MYHLPSGFILYRHKPIVGFVCRLQPTTREPLWDTHGPKALPCLLAPVSNEQCYQPLRVLVSTKQEANSSVV